MVWFTAAEHQGQVFDMTTLSDTAARIADLSAHDCKEEVREEYSKGTKDTFFTALHDFWKLIHAHPACFLDFWVLTCNDYSKVRVLVPPLPSRSFAPSRRKCAL